MENLEEDLRNAEEYFSDAENEFVRDIKSFFIRHNIKLLRWAEVPDIIYMSNGNEFGDEKEIFMTFEELSRGIGVKTI